MFFGDGDLLGASGQPENRGVLFAQVGCFLCWGMLKRVFQAAFGWGCCVCVRQPETQFSAVKRLAVILGDKVFTAFQAAFWLA